MRSSEWMVTLQPMTLGDPNHAKLPIILRFVSSFVSLECVKLGISKFGLQIDRGQYLRMYDRLPWNRMYSRSRDLFKFWQISDHVSDNIS